MSQQLSLITPGEILQEEFMSPLKLTQRVLASGLGVPINRVSQIVNGKREITVDTAYRLGLYFGMQPAFWLNLQSQYNLRQIEISQGKSIAKKVTPYNSRLVGVQV